MCSKSSKTNSAPNKDFNRDYVRQKYLLVKKHDRVGAWPTPSRILQRRHSFGAHQYQIAHRITRPASQIEEQGEWLIIKHMYIELRLKPLNLFMQKATPEQKAQAVIDYGNCLKSWLLPTSSLATCCTKTSV